MVGGRAGYGIGSMNAWHYALNGEQIGPVPLTEVRRLLTTGELDPSDLVWTQGMAAWKPAGELPQFEQETRNDGPPPDDDPYAPSPAVLAVEPVPAELPDIEPGSERILLGECLSRAIALTVRHYRVIFPLCVIYLAIVMGASSALRQFDIHFLGYVEPVFSPNAPPDWRTAFDSGTAFSQIALHVLGTFLGLGLTRIALNLARGGQVTVAMLFGEGRKLLRVLVAGFLYGLMVLAGALLFIVPGIYLAMRFGMFTWAIVDRDMGILEAFSFSSRITRGNRMTLFLLTLISFALLVAGALPLLLGLLFTGPVVVLLKAVAYRWLVLGARSARDLSSGV